MPGLIAGLRPMFNHNRMAIIPQVSPQPACAQRAGKRPPDVRTRASLRILPKSGAPVASSHRPALRHLRLSIGWACNEKYFVHHLCRIPPSLEYRVYPAWARHHGP